MKKIFLSLLSMLLCVSSFANVTFSAEAATAGDKLAYYDPVYQTFVNELKVTLNGDWLNSTIDIDGETVSALPLADQKKLTLAQVVSGSSDEEIYGLKEYRVVAYYTTDGSVPNAKNGKIYYDSFGKNGDGTTAPFIKKNIRLDETSVVRVSVVVMQRGVYYQWELAEDGLIFDGLPDEHHDLLVFNKVVGEWGDDFTGKGKAEIRVTKKITIFEVEIPVQWGLFVDYSGVETVSGAYETTQIDKGYQAYIKKPVQGPKISVTDGLYQDVNESIVFADKVQITIDSEDVIPSNIQNPEKWFGTKVVYTGNGDDPRVEGTGAQEYEAPFTIYNDNDIRAAVLIVAKGSNGDAKPYGSDLTGLNCKLIELTSAQQAVWNSHNEDLRYVAGLCLKVINYKGDKYAILSDGTSTFTVKNSEDIVKNGYYFVAGSFKWDGIFNLAGFDAADPIIVSKYGGDKQFKMPATYISEENLAKWAKAETATALYNVSLNCTDFSQGKPNTAQCGKVEVVMIGKTIKEAYDGEINGNITVSGIIFGREKGTVYMFVTDFVQEDAIIVGEPEINVAKEKAVDASKPVTFKVEFPNVVINDPEVESYTINGKWSVRTPDGKVILSGDLDEISCSASETPKTEVVIEKGLYPDFDYYFTIDEVTPSKVVDGENVAINTEYPTTIKTFTTKPVEIIDVDEISVFDTEFATKVLYANSVNVLDKESIMIINSKTGEDFTANSVTANGTTLNFDVEGLGDDYYVYGLDFGKYQVIVEEEALDVNGMVNPKRLEFNISVGTDEDKARIELMKLVDEYYRYLWIAPRGVNVFQYLPAVYDKFNEAVNKAWDRAHYFSDDDETAELKEAYDILKEAFTEFIPTQPGDNLTHEDGYYIRIIKDGNGGIQPRVKAPDYDNEIEKDSDPLYLNIDGDKPVLSSTPSRIYFHATKIYDRTETSDYYADKLRNWYLYNTANERYLSYDELWLEDEEYEYWYCKEATLSTDGSPMTEFVVTTTHYNEWLIEPANSWGMLAADVAKKEVFMYNPWDELDNKTFANIRYNWYIEYAGPAEAEEDAESGESSAEATVISSVDAAKLNATFYSISGAKLNGAQKGLNIAKFDNGTVKKYIVK